MGLIKVEQCQQYINTSEALQECASSADNTDKFIQCDDLDDILNTRWK